MKEKVSIISIIVNVILAGGKIIIGLISNSSAILAEGIHSFIDIFSSLISFIGIKIAKKPEDKKHPYGHYKFEVLSGLLITIILFTTGVWIIYKTYFGFLEPEKIIIDYFAFGIMIFSAIANEIMARIKIYYGKAENSISLLSDGAHSRIDVYSSLGVFIGLILTRYWIYVDSILALLIGLYIIKESFTLGKEAIDSLLDVSAGEEIENKIKSMVKKQEIEIENLKTQKKGSAISANLEIKLPKGLNIEKASKISEDLRTKLMTEIKNLTYIAIQIKAYDVETRFYKPAFGQGFGWQKRGKYRNQDQEADAPGPGGYCVCTKCGYKITHQRGVPCFKMQCPNCKINLKRE